jgi:hypothetical protein
MEPRSWTDSRLAAERAIWRCFGLRRAEALDWGSDDSSIALGVNAGDTSEMRYALGSIADGDGLMYASCVGRRRGMGDNARKGTCTLMRTNEIYSSQIPKTRRSSNLINARLASPSREVLGICMRDIRCLSKDDPSNVHGVLHQLSLRCRLGIH